MENSNEQSQGQTIKCPQCNEDIQLGAKKCKHCQADLRSSFAKHKILTGFLILVVFIIFVSIIGSYNETQDTMNDGRKTVENNEKQLEKYQAIVDNTQEAKPVADANAEPDVQTKTVTVPAEYKSALSQATTYANTMNMSKQGVYDQLVSEYGGKFSVAAAQYGRDNVKSDWNANALAQAKTYQDTMHLSPVAVRDQLVSAYGGKFTKAEADYAIQHLND
jgi:hypothetical protein